MDWQQFCSSGGVPWDPSQPATLQCLEGVVATLITAFVGLTGITLFIMFTLGGFMYLTAGADAKKAEKARNTMLYAVVGIVVMILCYIALKAIEWFTGVEVTVFRIPSF